jgi:hypothetical protein
MKLNLLARACKCRMSELGKELLELMESDPWELRDYRLTHRGTGVTLWTGNGFSSFQLYDVEKLAYTKDQYKNALNFYDRHVLWQGYKQFKRQELLHPTSAALNVVRLYKIKGEIK